MMMKTKLSNRKTIGDRPISLFTILAVFSLLAWSLDMVSLAMERILGHSTLIPGILEVLGK